MDEYVELQHNAIDGGLYCRVGQFETQRFKIRIPAGINGWTVSWQAYAAETGILRMALDAPPGADVIDVDDTRKTLELLWAGKQLRAIGPAGSGGMAVSTYQSDTTFKTDRERWLYCDAHYPGGRLIALESRLWGTPQAITPAAPDAQEEAVQYAIDAGMVKALVDYVQVVRADRALSPYGAAIRSGVMESLTAIAKMARQA